MDLYRLFWVVIFFLVGTFIISKVHVANTTASIAALGIICLIYSFLPELHLENQWFQDNYGWIFLVIIAIGVFFYLRSSVFHQGSAVFDILITLFIFLGLSVVYFLVQKKERMSSLMSGVIFSAPLYFLNPLYAIYGFLGFFAVWVSTKV